MSAAPTATSGAAHGWAMPEFRSGVLASSYLWSPVLFSALKNSPLFGSILRVRILDYDPQPSVGTAGLDGFASGLHAKNDVNDPPHLIEPLRVQVVGHLDVLMVLPSNLEGEAPGREP